LVKDILFNNIYPNYISKLGDGDFKEIPNASLSLNSLNYSWQVTANDWQRYKSVNVMSDYKKFLDDIVYENYDAVYISTVGKKYEIVVNDSVKITTSVGTNGGRSLFNFEIDVINNNV